MAAATAAAVAAAVIGGASAAADRSQNKKALKTQQEQNASNATFLSDQSSKASKQATTLFDLSEKNRKLGAQRALGILGQTIPQQIGAFQQGNLGAQQQLVAGLPQIQNALMGLPTDVSSFQPQQVQIDPSFSQQTLPHFQTSKSLGLTGRNFSRDGTGFDRPDNLNFGFSGPII